MVITRRRYSDNFVQWDFESTSRFDKEFGLCFSYRRNIPGQYTYHDQQKYLCTTRKFNIVLGPFNLTFVFSSVKLAPKGE